MKFPRVDATLLSEKCRKREYARSQDLVVAGDPGRHGVNRALVQNDEMQKYNCRTVEE
jgi:hypothetical protein